MLLFTGSLRRQGSIVQPPERWRNGSLPAQEPRIAPHGTDGDQLRHRFIPSSVMFIGFLRRQGPIGQPLERWRDGSLPAQGPGTSQILATPNALPQRHFALSSPCPRVRPTAGPRINSGRDLSCNHSIAGEMGSCLQAATPDCPAWHRRGSASASFHTLKRDVYRVPAKAGTHRATARALAKWVPACAGSRHFPFSNSQRFAATALRFIGSPQARTHAVRRITATGMGKDRPNAGFRVQPD